MLLLLKKALDLVIKRFGYKTVRIGQEKRFISFYNCLRLSIAENGKGIHSLVFSKDRAMQLHAFLDTYFENITNNSSITVLYKASNDEHLKSYYELIKLYEYHPVTFIRENSFRKQMLDILNETKANKIFLYVDDMLFTHKFDYQDLEKINPYKYIVALSRGQDMTYSSVLKKPLTLPGFEHYTGDLYKFSWKQISYYSDWSYPLGVSGYMYARNELLSMMQAIAFSAPNSLESSIQYFLPVFDSRMGLCPKNAVSVCVHANLTQTEGANPVLGFYSVDKLLEKWQQGLQIDYREFYDKPMTVTQEQNFTFSKRCK